jgi:hypothetical protein
VKNRFQSLPFKCNLQRYTRGKDIALAWRAAAASNPLLPALAAHLPCWIFGDGMELEAAEGDGGGEGGGGGSARRYSRASEAALFRAVQLCPELAAHLAAAASGGC